MTHTIPSPGSAFPFESRYAEVAGFRIHYVEEGQGAPVLFVHGNPTSSYVWRNVLPAVARATGRRAIALDLLGFGLSPRPDVDYSLALHAQIVEGFIRRLALRQLVLVAEDWGGPLAMRYAIRHQDNVQGVSLQETFLWPMTWEEDFAPQFRGPFKLMRSPVGFVFSQVLNLMVKKLIPEHCPISRESLDHYLRASPTVFSRRAIAAFPKLLPVEGEPEDSVEFFEEIQDELPRLRFPVQWIKATPGVVPGDDYPPSLAKLQQASRTIPRFEFAQFGPGYHFLCEENPGRVADLLSAWINRLGAESRSSAPVQVLRA